MKDHKIVHGYDSENQEIVENVSASEFTEKLIHVDRVLSVSEKYILTSYAYNRVIYWEYEGGLASIQAQLGRLKGF